MTKLSPVKAVILIGLALRIVLLYLGYGHQGHWTADTLEYIGLSKLFLPGHDISFFAFHFPPGFPIMLVPFNFLGDNFWFFSLVMAFISVWFAYWFAKKTRAFWPVFLFLIFDPVFLTHPLLVSSDFIAMIIFTGAVLAFIQTPSRIYLSGFLWVVSMFFRPVYIWTPVVFMPFLVWHIIKHKIGWKSFVGFILTIYVPVFLYCEARFIETGFFGFSGHNSFLFGKYVTGRILTVLDKSADPANFEQLAVDTFNKYEQVEHNLKWEKFTKDIVSQHPIIFAKLVAISAVRGAMGNANMEFVRLIFKGQHQSPGLWASASNGESFFNRLKSLNYFYLFGALLEAVIHSLLFYFAFRNSTFRSLESVVVYCSLWLLVFYFIFSPIVFGETRLFLPATIVLLLCSSYSFGLKEKPS